LGDTSQESESEMKRKIGPGVYVVDEIGTLQMEQWVIDDRKSKGLSVPESRPTPAAPDADPQSANSSSDTAQPQSTPRG